VYEAPNESLLLLQSFMAILTLTALAIAAEVSERKKYETNLIQMIDHDSLTGVMTRRRFLTDLERYLAQARRYGTHGALMLLDLDDFKSVNDTLGHPAADKLLTSVADLLHRRLRDSDILGRLGGDEFAILLPQTDEPQALRLADQLQAAIASHATLVGGRPLKITASIGITLFPQRGISVMDLVSQADLAMYQAKGAGRNLTRLYVEDTEWQERLAAEFKGEESVREALENGLFVLHGQPILDLRRDEIWRYELLLRMVGKDRRLVRPGVFLSAAERSGLILEIDRWVISQAIDLIARHPEEPGVSVNLSEKALCDPGLPSLIRRELTAIPTDPGRLTLEIAETAVTSNPERTHNVVRALKSVGCGIAVDDFGAEFTSLDRLERLPVDYLKIEESFIRESPHSPVDRALVTEMVERAHLMGRKTIAKSVEDAETLRQLRAYGIDYAQGFHIGRPRPMRDLRREGGNLQAESSRAPRSGNQGLRDV